MNRAGKVEETGPGDVVEVANRLVGRLKDESTVVIPGRVVACLRGLRGAQKSELALYLVELAIVRFPDHAPLLVEAARVHEQAGVPLRAAALFGQALLIQPDPEGSHVRAMSRCLQAAGASADQIDAAFGPVVLAQPASGVRVEGWIRLLRSTGAQDLDDRLARLQEATADPLVAVLLHLSPERRSRFADKLAAFLSSADAQTISRIWARYGHLASLPAADAEAATEIPDEVARLLFESQSHRILTFAQLDGMDLSEFGLNADALQWYAEEFLRPDLPRPDDFEFVSSYARDYVERNEPCLAFQSRSIRDRRLRLRDPFTNTEQVPFDTVIAHGRTVYSFGDRELTWLIAGGGGSKAVCLLIPRLRLIIDLGAMIWPHLPPAKIATTQAVMTKRVAAQRDAYARAIARRPDPTRDQTVVVQTLSVENFAHHLWNTFPGVERIAEFGLARNVDEVHTVGTEFFGSFLEMFPEFSAARVVDGPRQNIRDPYPFSADHLIVVLGGYFMRRSLISRVVERMTALPSGGAAEPPPGDSRPFPIVWIGLRVGSRAWVDQEHEVPWLIDALHEVHPDALVLLDGYSYPVGRDKVSDRWARAIEQLHALSHTIRSSAKRPDQVVDLVGNTLRESVMWAQATDVYVAPNGSSQHKIGWLCDGPGISYAPPRLTTIPVERRPGAYESEGRPIPVTVIGTPESQGERRSVHDARHNLENIRLDRREMLETLLRLIDERRAR